MPTTLRPHKALGSAALLLLTLALGACNQKKEVTATTSDVRATADATSDSAIAVQPAEPDPYARGQAETSIFLAAGTVEKVDAQNSRITVKHEAVPAINVPAGSSEFIVQDEDTLAVVKQGQPIEFSFLQDVEGKYVITAISPTPPQD
jgi:Cu(I)/Ag(I) efflux system protein CusF